MFSALTVAIDTSGHTTLTALNTLGAVHRRLNYRASLNISGISFKLPRHSNIGDAFFTVTLSDKLSTTVVGPHSASVVHACFTCYTVSTVSSGYVSCVGFTRSVPGLRAISSMVPINGRRDGLSARLRVTVTGNLGSETKRLAQTLAQSASPLSVMRGRVVPTLSRINGKCRRGQVCLPSLLVDTRSTGTTFRIVGRLLPTASTSTGDKGIIVTAIRNSVRSVKGGVIQLVLRGCNFSIVSLNGSIPPRAMLTTIYRGRTPIIKLDTLVAAAMPTVRRAVGLVGTRTPCYGAMINNTILGDRCTREVNTSFCTGSTVRAMECTRDVMGGGGWGAGGG